ncbi:MAG: NAD+ synthase [Promethearchaeia archaeon]
MRHLDYKTLTENIQDWIREYTEKAGSEGIVVGLSGGIDSSVTAALSVRAIGKNNVLGFSLPCNSMPKDYEDAKLIAEFLDIDFRVVDLSSIYDECKDIFLPKLQVEKNIKIAKANIKPRLRMVTLYFFGQAEGNYLIGGTGNRTEIAIGYFTKYGDGGVDIEPLGTLYKSEVYEVAQILDVPKKIINRAPSAGLWKEQTDEGEIGITYDELDEILYRIDSNLSLDELNQKNVKKVKKMLNSSEHKKKMPPVYKIKQGD